MFWVSQMKYSEWKTISLTLLSGQSHSVPAKSDREWPASPAQVARGNLRPWWATSSAPIPRRSWSWWASVWAGTSFASSWAKTWRTRSECCAASACARATALSGGPPPLPLLSSLTVNLLCTSVSLHLRPSTPPSLCTHAIKGGWSAALCD